MAEMGSVTSTGKLSWNWDDMFVATTTGAISGAFQSPGMQKFMDKTIWGGVSSGYLQGVTSNVIGGVISTTVKGADKKGWRGIFDISDQWPSALGNAFGQISHQFLSDDSHTNWYSNIRWNIYQESFIQLCKFIHAARV